MYKLKIPTDPLLGSPLTDEELKSIIGGQTNAASRSCDCHYQVGWIASEARNESVFLGNVTDEADCKSRCKVVCEDVNKTSCPSFYTVYFSCN